MQPFKKVLLHVDDAEHTPDTVKPLIQALCRHEPSLTIVTSVRPSTWFAKRGIQGLTKDDVLDEMRALALERLETLADRFRKADIETTCQVLVGNPALVVVRAALRGSYDVIVRASAGVLRGDEPTVGSIEFRLVRGAPCPVVLARTVPETAKRRIFVALEYDPTEPRHADLNLEVLEAATRLAHVGNNELYVLHAWRLWGESLLRSGRARLPREEVDSLVEAEEMIRREWLEELLEGYRAELPSGVRERLEIRTQILQGSVDDLVETAHSLGGRVLVLGSLARVGVPGFLVGNTAERILHAVALSVMVVKHPDFVSPITL